MSRKRFVDVRVVGAEQIEQSCGFRARADRRTTPVSRRMSSASCWRKSGYCSASGWTFSTSCSRSHCAAKRVASASERGSAMHALRPAPATSPGFDSAPRFARVDQRRIGRLRPEEERQPRREVEVGDRIALARLGTRRRFLDAKHEVRARQNRLERRPNSKLESTSWRPDRRTP